MTEQNQLYLDIMGFGVLITADYSEILGNLARDFYYFFAKDFRQPDLKIKIHEKNASDLIIPETASTRLSHLCITYDQGKLRYVDYHGKLRCLFNFSKETADIYSIDKNKIHEITYLLVLSRAGKALDLKGFHRIHGFGIYQNGTICIGIMPSKGGKSTLLQSLLKDEAIELISDDTPMVDRSGKILSFPIRIGRESEFPSDFPIKDREANLYTLDREIWGRKYLLSTRGLPHKIYKPIENPSIKLFFGKRYSGARGKVIEISKFQAFRHLIVSCIIGHGLPIIFEYFWEEGVEDFLKKAKIAISRSISCLSLVLRSKCFEIQLGSDLDYNQEMIRQQLTTD